MWIVIFTLLAIMAFTFAHSLVDFVDKNLHQLPDSTIYITYMQIIIWLIVGLLSVALSINSLIIDIIGRVNQPESVTTEPSVETPSVETPSVETPSVEKEDTPYDHTKELDKAQPSLETFGVS